MSGQTAASVWIFSGAKKRFPGAVFTRRDESDGAHFLLVTFWDGREAVKAFAGADPAKAKYYPEDDRYLLEKESQSLNHQVFFDSDDVRRVP